MSTFTKTEINNIEKFLGMSSGYVLDFSDRTFSEFVLDTVGINIHDEKYTANGTSKANKLRTFCKLEHDHTVGKLILALIEYGGSHKAFHRVDVTAIADKCRQFATSVPAGGAGLESLKELAKNLNASYLEEQIRRMEASVETDPSLAIGTAKELIETCCKTILAERGKPMIGTPDMSTLTKETLKELKLVPVDVPNASRGEDVMKQLLSNLGTIGKAIAELRNLYGTGHGNHGSAIGLSKRHAKLAVGAATTLCVFLFETHEDTKV